MADLITSTPVDDFLQAGSKPAMRTALDLGNVNNTSDANKPVSTAQAAADQAVADEAAQEVQDLATATTAALAGKASAATVAAHIADTANPHNVTKTQVGLGNADNTSDANKPVSTATQTALDLKAPLASPALTGTPTAPTAAPGTNTTQLATTAYTVAAISAAVSGLLDLKGSIDASTNPNYPAASKGDAYYISVAGKIGGAAGKSVEIGDLVVASADNAGGTEAAVGTSWFVLEHNLVGALLSANNLSDLANAGTARTNLGLGNVNNTSDANKPVSTATQTALDLKAPKTAIGLQISLGLACSDMTTAIVAGTNKAYFPAPFDGTLDEVFVSSNTAPTGSTQIFDVNKNGVTMLSTKVTIDAGENSSLTAAVPPVISVNTFSKGDFISVDFDQVGSSTAGLGIVAMFKLTRTA